MCGILEGHKPAPMGEREMGRGPLFPEGSGDKESPEEPYELVGEELRSSIRKAEEVYNARMWLFERSLKEAKRRKSFRDYTTKNCEEAWGCGR